jgi:radical SAM superfamily enzyme YgiQ (UPF0313 family)
MAIVLVISPPNSNQLFDDLTSSGAVPRPEDLTDWANLPNLGVLTLASAIADLPDVEPVYIDGTVVAWADILDFVTDSAHDILAVCVSVLTASYETALALLRHTKAIRPEIVTILGNDHFTAMHVQCLQNNHALIDYGFVGNEVVGPFRALIGDLARGQVRGPGHYPGLVGWTPAGVVATPQAPEPVFTAHRFDLIDRVFDHTAKYRENFRTRVGPRLEQLLGVTLELGTPLELARGCIKFSRDDACTFCSIQYGGMWKNSVSGPREAWDTIAHAFGSGYEFLSLTADELPLTFGALLREMAAGPPSWWRDLSEHDRPVFGGYARADGLSNPRHAATLRALNIRYLMVGLDAGSATSLGALNKPLAPVKDNDSTYRAERMFQHNIDALEIARDEGLFVKAGFVLGHLGMDARLLAQNVESICSIIDHGTEAIASSDIEVLSPEPGSTDFRYLTEPELATAAAARLGLRIADEDVRERIAKQHRDLDVIDRERAMDNYTQAVMPELTLDDLAAARATVRNHCKAKGVLVGE